MIYVQLPENSRQRLPFYLAMEEYVAREISDKAGDDLFFMWQVSPTVIFGRNQIIDNEVNIAYCQEHGIEMYRRKSGGGCVFANPDNIMFSYITRSASDVATTFSHYTSMIAGMLRTLGLNASASSRNDVLIGTKKVSGNAFYHIPGHSIVHGTMLFDTDQTHMASAITPSKAKLQAKGVASVRSHITTLREHLDIDIERFKDYTREYLCDSSITLTDKDIIRIREIERPYYDEEWIFRRHHSSTHRRNKRIEGVGEFQVSLDTDPTNRISRLDIAGDFFLIADMDELLVDRLKGVKHDPQAVVEALKGFSAGNVIHGLTNQQLLELLF